MSRTDFGQGISSTIEQVSVHEAPPLHSGTRDLRPSPRTSLFGAVRSVTDVVVIFDHLTTSTFNSHVHTFVLHTPPPRCTGGESARGPLLPAAHRARGCRSVFGDSCTAQGCATPSSNLPTFSDTPPVELASGSDGRTLNCCQTPLSIRVSLTAARHREWRSGLSGVGGRKSLQSLRSSRHEARFSTAFTEQG